jgi:transcriptional regulator with XRE-family HTH domain
MALTTKMKIRMLQRGFTQRSIAKSLGIKPEAVYQEMSGRRVSQRVRDAIIEAFGWPEKKIWPKGIAPVAQRYSAKGKTKQAPEPKHAE